MTGLVVWPVPAVHFRSGQQPWPGGHVAVGRLARPFPGLRHTCSFSAPGGREGTHLTEEETEALRVGPSVL